MLNLKSNARKKNTLLELELIICLRQKTEYSPRDVIECEKGVKSSEAKSVAKVKWTLSDPMNE